MFTIKNKQLQVFKELFLKKFEDEMVVHIKTFFPTHYMIIGENVVSNTIQYGYVQAKKYGFTTRRNVCLYLNCMMILGSNFDCDPQYPWARLILNDENEQDPIHRIDTLSEKALELINRITGPDHIYLNRALFNLHTNAGEIFEKLINGNKGLLNNLNTLFPKKYEAIGEMNLRQMEKLGISKAGIYGITNESYVLIYHICMFMMGSHFDKDPQFTWAADILNDPATSDQKIKIKLLYENVIGILRSFIFRINDQ